VTERRSGWLFASPVVAAFSLVAVYPLCAALWLSLHRSILSFHEQRFIGLDNFAFLLTDARFWAALGHTLYFAAVAVSTELVLGLGCALLLNASFKGRGIVRAAVLVPWAIPTVVSAQLWAHLFNPEGGLLPALLPGKDINFLGTPGYAMHAAILVDVWKTTPFVTLLLLAGLQTLPKDVYAAARIDGASRARIFWSITLPLLRPTIAVTLVFRALDALRVFDAVYVLTGGGPANTTETLSIYAYKTLMRSGDFGYGSTLAVATFVCVAGLAALYLRLAMPKEATR
jgi:multiple sugar transport system permease protein